MTTTLYRLRTTFIGASAPSEFYFNTLAHAEMNLHHLSNGEIEKVRVTSDGVLNYFDGCTYNDLTIGGLIRATVKEA